jgi:hypothetical protein
MNREELDWLLQTTKDAEAAERFVLAQYELGRISFQMMADVAREWGWINRSANVSSLLFSRLTRATRRSRSSSFDTSPRTPVAFLPISLT